MSNLRYAALAGASALALAAGAAQAQTELYGNGASLPADVLRAAEDCYGQSLELAIQGTTTTFKTVPAATIPTTTDTCATVKVDPTVSIYYTSTGSGNGIRNVYRNNGDLAGDYLSAAGIQLFPKLHYGASETSLGDTEVNTYNNGGTIQTNTTVVAPGVTPPAGQFKNPNEFYGPLVQFPLLIAPVAIGYDPVYRKDRNGSGGITEYTFNINLPRADGSGGLRLDRPTYCRIFNGQLTNWNQISKKLNGKVSLKDPDQPGAFSVPLQIVGRSDSSGTTSLWTRHLAAACATTAGNQYADSTPTLPALLLGPVYNTANPNDPVAGEAPTKYTVAPGNPGVAKYVDFTRVPGPNPGDSVVQGRIAYFSNDFVLPASGVTGTNAFALHSADLRNLNGRYVAPTPQAALKSFGAVLPPDSTGNGSYDAGSPDPRDRTDPADWVEPASKTSPIADPVGNDSYPIVGTSNFLGYTCYAVDLERQKVAGFLTWYNNDNASNNVVDDPAVGILARSGFSAMPSAWQLAIRQTFLNPVAATNPLGLQIRTAGATGVCATRVGAAP